MQEGTIHLLGLHPYGRAWNRWRPVSILFGRVQLYNLCRVFKPIAIVCVQWLWTVFWSLTWLDILFLCFFSPPSEWAQLWQLRCGDRSRWAPHHKWELGAGSWLWSGVLVWNPWVGCCWRIKDVSLYDPQGYGPHTFFTTGFPRFLSIRGARGLQAFNLQRHSNY
jgi:hypothetical protein